MFSPCQLLQTGAFRAVPLRSEFREMIALIRIIKKAPSDWFGESVHKKILLEILVFLVKGSL
jgi:hypothetical protein